MKPYEINETIELPPGPWSDEPHSVEWRDTETDYECCILRIPHSGHLCGYVKVPDDHSLCNKDYNDRISIPKGWMERKVNIAEDLGYLNAFCAGIKMDEETASIDILFFCHGGLTYGHGEGWFGFDCAHAGDLTPRYTHFEGDVYRDVNFVLAECVRLARQFWEYENLAEFK